MATGETDDDKAIRILNRQLKELVEDISSLNYRHARFKAWRDDTLDALQKFLAPDSPHLSRFRGLRFVGPGVLQMDTMFGGRPLPPDHISQEDHARFWEACQASEETLRAALRSIEDFGAHVGQATAAPSRGGVSQTFHGPVTFQNQAIATDNAVQRIGRMGDTGFSLKEVARLLQESMELTRRQMQEGLAGIEVLASEMEKPEEQRNWKSMLESGDKVLGITDKATDLAAKLGPYIPHIMTLMDQAKHWLK